MTFGQESASAAAQAATPDALAVVPAAWFRRICEFTALFNPHIDLKLNFFAAAACGNCGSRSFERANATGVNYV